MNETTAHILQVIFWISCGAVVYTYFLYPLLLLSVSRLVGWLRPDGLKSADTSCRQDYLPRVAMLISAYNEESVLPQKIANCRALDYPADKLTFYIGSDGSDDGTMDILNQVQDSRFHILDGKTRAGKVRMLNNLMKLVDSEIVIFSDANTMYHPRAVYELVKPFADPRVGCVNGKLELNADVDSDACRPEGLYWRYENRIKQMESILGVVPTINGGIFAIRSRLYEELPGEAITEDQVLGMKIMLQGYSCRFAARAKASESISNWLGELRRRIRISAGNFQSLFLVPGIINPRCGWVSFTFISHKLLRWLVPFFLAGIFLSNLWLVSRPFYNGLMLLQGLFYSSGLLGLVLPKLGLLSRGLALPKYFLAMNFAIFLGWLRFITRRQTVTWARTSR